MIKQLALLMAFLVSLFTVPVPNAIDNSLKDNLYSSVLIRIKVEIKDEDGQLKKRMAGCSGTYISQTEVLTAGHCISDDPDIHILKIWVRNIDGKSFTAKVKKVNHERDLALLNIDIGNHRHGIARIGQDKLKIGEDIRAIGNPLGLEFLVSKGIVSSIDLQVKEFKSKYIIHDAMINPGSSGGGLFNMKGELVGVNTMSVGGFFGWTGISLAVEADDVIKFLK